MLPDSPNRQVALGTLRPPMGVSSAGRVTGMVMMLSQPTAVPDGAARDTSMARTRSTMAG